MIHRPRRPGIELPPVPIHRLILDALAEVPDQVLMVEAASGRALTAAILTDRVHRLAAGLAARGFRQGDVLCLIAPNCLEYPVIFLAVSMLGGVAALPNPLGTTDDFTGQLVRTRSRWVATIPALLDKVRPAAAAAGIDSIIVIGEAEGAIPLESLLHDEPLTQFPEVAPTDLVALPFSSGTSGRPKAVMLTHRNLVANAHQFAAGMPLPDGTRLIAVLPFYHIYGLVLLMITSIWRRRYLVVMPRFELEPFLDAIARYRVELAPLVPPIMVALAKHPAVDKYDLSSLRLAMCGAAPLGADVEEAVARRLGIVIGQGYGMTEVCGASHLHELAPERIRRGAVGQLVANMEARIVDPETGHDVGLHQRGELWVRGPNVMAGYLDDAGATRNTIDPEGWLRTGDIAYVDQDGYFFVVDRLKELISTRATRWPRPTSRRSCSRTHPSPTRR
jgi:acyl-CoA synthetase (AMP-forming)/AMP-acid ligase II